MIDSRRNHSTGTVCQRRPARTGAIPLAGTATLLVLALATSGGIWWFVANRETSDGSANILLHTVKRGDFELTVTERGEIEAFDVVEIRSLVKSNNTAGNAILRIVPEGTEVNKGDFLVELDASALESQRTSQRILVNAAKAAEVEAKNTYDTAVIAKREYLDGTFLQERQVIESEVFVAEENLNRSKEYYAYSQKLASKGYVNELQLEADRFAVEKAKKDLDAANTKLHVLDEFTKAKMLSTLESAIQIADAKWDAARNSHELEVDKLKEIDDQIAKCTIIAPEDGVVKYAHVTDGRGDQEFIVEEGTIVRERQVIITLPKANAMRVELNVNESLVRYVKPGLPAIINPVGFGDRYLRGSVEKVNQYAEPSGWRQANVKEYKAFVSIDQPDPNLRAGLTAAVTIQCSRLPSAMQVPVQSVYAHGRDFFCFVYNNGSWEAREIEPGPTNDTFFVVESGLNEGDRVAMNPRSHVGEVSLPELSPEEAQRAVPQRVRDDEDGSGPSAEGPGAYDGRGQRGGRRGDPSGERMPGDVPREEPLQPGQPDGSRPGDTRAPAPEGAPAQVRTAANNSRYSQGTAE